MKTKFVVFLDVLLLGFLLSCATGGTKGAYRPLSEVPDAQVIGTVQTSFVAPPGLVGFLLPFEDAYIALLGEAQKSYQGNIDVKDITCVRGTPASAYGATYNYNASGKVVLLGNAAGNATTAARGVEGAVARAADQAVIDIPAQSKIGIVYITATDKSTTEYIAGELEYIWVKAGYFIIDRSQLDRLRAEQNFQMSGEIDDETAVSIGKIAGANIIVTGRVDGEGELRRLRLRALDIQTAQVVGVASERY